MLLGALDMLDVYLSGALVDDDLNLIGVWYSVSDCRCRNFVWSSGPPIYNPTMCERSVIVWEHLVAVGSDIEGDIKGASTLCRIIPDFRGAGCVAA